MTSAVSPESLLTMGAVLAALLGGTFSLVNLHIAENQKLSEIRQLDVEKFRAELATFVARAKGFAEMLGVATHMLPNAGDSIASFVNDNQDQVRKLRRSYFLLKLHSELSSGIKERKTWKEFVRCLDFAFTSLFSLKVFEPNAIDECLAALVQIGDAVVEEMGEAVRRGSAFFRTLKVFFICVVLLSVAALAYLIFTAKVASDEEKHRILEVPGVESNPGNAEESLDLG